MSDLIFSIDLSASKENLLKLLTDYTNFPNYLPHQIKSVIIIEKTDSFTITEETLHLSSVISKTFVQQTKHFAFSNDTLKSEILTGPAKNSIMELKFDEKNSITNVSVKINIKLGLKYKFLSPIIKKSYKTFLMGILYKMQALANSS